MMRSDRRWSWRGAIAGEEERSQVEGSGCRWRANHTLHPNPQHTPVSTRAQQHTPSSPATLNHTARAQPRSARARVARASVSRVGREASFCGENPVTSRGKSG